MSGPGNVRGEMYTKILYCLLTGQRLTIDERERELGGSVFGIKEAFNTFSLAYDKSMISTPDSKSIEVVVQPLLVKRDCQYSALCHWMLSCRSITKI